MAIGAVIEVYAGLTIRDAADAIDFYKKIFNAEEVTRVEEGGKILHSEILIGKTKFMINDEMPGTLTNSPATIGGTPVTFYVYVDDVDAVYNNAIAEGAFELFPVNNQFYGDRVGGIQDPYGFKWSIATKYLDVPPEEIKSKMAPFMRQYTLQRGGVNGKISDENDRYYDKYLKYKDKYLKMKGGMKGEMESEMKGGMKGEMKGEMKGGMKGEMKGAKGEMKGAKGEMKSEMKGAKSEMKGGMKGEMKSEMKSEMKGDMKGGMKGEMKGDMKGGMKGGCACGK